MPNAPEIQRPRADLARPAAPSDIDAKSAQASGLRAAVLEDPDDARAEPESLPIDNGVPLLRKGQRH